MVSLFCRRYSWHGTRELSPFTSFFFSYFFSPSFHFIPFLPSALTFFFIIYLFCFLIYLVPVLFLSPSLLFLLPLVSLTATTYRPKQVWVADIGQLPRLPRCSPQRPVPVKGPITDDWLLGFFDSLPSYLLPFLVILGHLKTTHPLEFFWLLLFWGFLVVLFFFLTGMFSSVLLLFLFFAFVSSLGYKTQKLIKCDRNDDFSFFNDISVTFIRRQMLTGMRTLQMVMAMHMARSTAVE